MPNVQVVEGASEGDRVVVVEGCWLYLGYFEGSGDGGVFGQDGQVVWYFFDLLLKEFIDWEGEDEGGDTSIGVQLG